MVQKYAPAGLPVYFRGTSADSAFCKSKTEKGYAGTKASRNVSRRETHFFNFIIEPAADFLNSAVELYIKFALQLNIVAKTLLA